MYRDKVDADKEAFSDSVSLLYAANGLTSKTRLPASSVGIQSMHQANRKLTDTVSAKTCKDDSKNTDDQKDKPLKRMS